MFKKSILCLALALCMLFSSCNTAELKKDITVPVKVALTDKNEDFFPQDNIVEYVLDSSIKRIPAKILENRQVFFLGIEAEFKENITDLYGQYFVNNFEKNYDEFVSIEESDTLIHVILDFSVNAASPEIKKTSTKPRMMYVGMVPWDEVLPKETPNYKLLPEPEESSPAQAQYDLQKRTETMLVKASLIVLDKDSNEILYFDKIACLSIYNSTDIQKQP